MRSNHRSHSTEGWNHDVLNMGGLVTLPSEAGIWANVDATLTHNIFINCVKRNVQLKPIVSFSLICYANLY